MSETIIYQNGEGKFDESATVKKYLTVQKVLQKSRAEEDFEKAIKTIKAKHG